MSEERKKEIERIEKYLFLLKSLKDESLIQKSIDRRYIYYLNIAKKEKEDVEPKR